MRQAILALLFGLAAVAGATASRAAETPDGYTYFSVGDVSAPRSGGTEPAMMLMGGGDWDYDAFRWFLGKAGNGHIVILRASGDGEAGEEIYRDIGGAASVQTLLFDDRKAAQDPRVLAILEQADGIFLAGGDQAKYVRFWKDTPIETALNAHVARGRPIGGTSAGLAILGGAGYGAMDDGSVDSEAALKDPMGPEVTMVRDFLAMPYLAHVVTDTHFSARDRLGRLIAFVAQTRATDDPAAVGLGVDEDGALCVEADGIGRFHTASSGYVWLVQPEGAPQAVLGQPLDYAAVRVTTMGVDGEIDLKTMTITRSAFSGTASVQAGHLLDAPTGQ
ncbi:cyanophycinase [Brevundimonas bullata]|uniref:cyanophycinase n=1 Tax=Brevundimonas bullata TaxID=13160 RepID=UPI000E0BFC3B|nr:cyanophycinase [Brevundimonas bullata]WQE37645.1 cyanophycinase [Brevundimonas bullata]